MESIKIIKNKLSKNSKDKLINMLAIATVTMSYVYLLNILIVYSLELIYLIQKGECFKSKYHREFNSLSYITLTIISPLFFANYFYNNSKFRKIKIGRIRFVMMVIGSTILFGGFLAWLKCFKIVDFSLFFKKHPYLSLNCVIICQSFLIMNIIVRRNNVPWAFYLSAHIFWILALFFMISSMLYLENESKIFSLTNLIILTTLTIIAVTYSCLQQYIYRKIRRFFCKDDLQNTIIK